MNMDWVLDRIPALLVVQCNESRICNAFDHWNGYYVVDS